jgi:predicted GNAT family N-acyltransferase
MDRRAGWTLVELGQLTSEQRSQLEGDEVDPFGSTGSDLVWRPKEHHVALVGEDGRLAAAAGWVLSEVEVAGGVIPVVGIGGVIVAAAHRGGGMGRRVIAEVMERAGREGPRLAMLFCQEDRVSLYQRRGFVRIEHPVIVEQPGGAIEAPIEAMWRSLRSGALLPEGPVHVRGLPF